MKTKTLSFVGLCALVAPTTAFMASCGGGGSVTVDAKKTQIYVNNFKRGFGGEWLDNIKTRYEALHAEDSYEPGKKGVQVLISNSGTPAEDRISNIRKGSDEVFFTEQSSYFVLKANNILGDLTAAVEAPLTEYGETRSVKDKLTAAQIEYLAVDEGGTNHYYAIPHYSGYFGLSYDVDLFEEKNLYFAKEQNTATLDGHFVRNATEERSLGPDGQTGVIDGIDYSIDDGLPTTYEEFGLLCQFMVKKNVTPLIANGANAGEYMNLLMNTFATDHEGLDQMNIIFKSEGTLTDLGTVTNGTVSKMAPTVIDHQNGYMFSQMLGRYYAVSWFENMYKNNYIYDQIKSNAYTAGASHNDFLRSRISGANTGLKPTAMIAEGNWWENEASNSFEAYSTRFGAKWSKANRRFAYMPLPKATAERYSASQKNTMFDHLASLMFIKNNIPEEKKPLILDFVKFCNSDESLAEFTATTNTMKALDYSIPANKLNEMTYYGRSLYYLQKKSDIVYPFNGTQWFKNNTSFYDYKNLMRTKIGGVDKRYIWNCIQEKSSAETIFNGMLGYYQSGWNELVK